jgi:hypothetical protein
MEIFSRAQTHPAGLLLSKPATFRAGIQLVSNLPSFSVLLPKVAPILGGVTRPVARSRFQLYFPQHFVSLYRT